MLVFEIYWLYKVNISLEWTPTGGSHNLSIIFFNTLINRYQYWVDCHKEHIISSTSCPTQSLNQGWQNDTLWCLPTISPFFKGKRGFLFHILSKFIPLSEISNLKKKLSWPVFAWLVAIILTTRGGKLKWTTCKQTNNSSITRNNNGETVNENEIMYTY